MEIDAKWFKAHEKEFLEAFNKAYPNDTEDHNKQFLIEMPFEMEDFSVGENSYRIDYADRIPEQGTKMRVLIKHQYSAELLGRLAEHIVKKLNKAKAYFETMRE